MDEAAPHDEILGQGINGGHADEGTLYRFHEFIEGEQRIAQKKKDRANEYHPEAALISAPETKSRRTTHCCKCNGITSYWQIHFV